MSRKLIWLAVLIFVGVAVFGCEVKKTPDGKKTINIDPNKAAQFEQGAETGASIMMALAPIWPPAAGLAAGLLAALGAWRKQKAKLIVEQGKTKMYYSASSALVEAIADYRTENPAAWAKLKKQLKDAVGPEAENVIRGIRGLPERT